MSPLFHIKKQVVEKRVGRHHQFVLHTNMRVINQLLMLTKKRVVSSHLIGKGDWGWIFTFKSVWVPIELLYTAFCQLKEGGQFQLLRDFAANPWPLPLSTYVGLHWFKMCFNPVGMPPHCPWEVTSRYCWLHLAMSWPDSMSWISCSCYRKCFSLEGAETVLSVDASNSLNHNVALHNIQLEYPAISMFLINTYMEASELFIDGEVIYNEVPSMRIFFH